MTQYLAVTAMGTDRPGIVNKLATLTASCDCDIIDSRVAIFGNEFSLIMLVGGSYSAIARLENELPMHAAQWELLTICKRTSEHTAVDFTSRLVVEFEGQDRRGTMKQITQFLADRELDLAGFSSNARQSEDGSGLQQVEVRINATARVDLDALEANLSDLAGELNLTCRFRRMEGAQTD
ncbi:glycine cleavage system protein R [Ferrimonas balearica]|uniref:glycine cleavage system protein R n=1 Tax=Ferrimonas balearica TaxID=44012 RepID=UPI001C567ABE|nr:ACT domain-containing protein [Ferrimonas balearica]MBW3164050.1 glycine cleavage system transcriptional repressor [Ferrimonas balearica]